VKKGKQHPTPVNVMSYPGKGTFIPGAYETLRGTATKDKEGTRLDRLQSSRARIRQFRKKADKGDPWEKVAYRLVARQG